MIGNTVSYQLLGSCLLPGTTPEAEIVTVWGLRPQLFPDAPCDLRWSMQVTLRPSQSHKITGREYCYYFCWLWKAKKCPLRQYQTLIPKTCEYYMSREIVEDLNQNAVMGILTKWRFVGRFTATRGESIQRQRWEWYGHKPRNSGTRLKLGEVGYRFSPIVLLEKVCPGPTILIFSQWAWF